MMIRRLATSAEWDMLLVFELDPGFLQSLIYNKLLGLSERLSVTGMLPAHVYLQRLCACETMTQQRTPFNRAEANVALFTI